MEEIRGKIVHDLREVETTLRGIVSSLPELSGKVALYLLESGGKRLRPALTVASGRVFGEASQQLYSAAAAVELVHTASLIHDDLVDGSNLRRGKESAPAAFGEEVALIVADFLFVKAFEVAKEVGGLEALEVLSQAVMRMCEGELEELESRGKLDLDFDGYIERVKKKTGSLMGACCVLGAIIAKADSEEATTLGRFGETVGVAFQAVDDLLDLLGDPSILGKPRGSDLRAGKASLPMLLLLSDGSRKIKERTLALLEKPEEERALEEIARIAQEVGVPRRGLELVARTIEKAKRLLEMLPDSTGKRMLEFLAEEVEERGRKLLKMSKEVREKDGQGFGKVN